MKRVFPYLKPYLFICVLAQLSMVGEVSMDLIQPRLMSKIVDEGVLGLSNNGVGGLNLILGTGIQMIGLVMAGAFCGVISGVFCNIASQSFSNDVRRSCFRRVVNFSFEQTDRFSTGSLVPIDTVYDTVLSFVSREHIMWGSDALSRWDKLVAEILKQNPNLRFEDLCKALVKIGYTAEQLRGGSSHYTFRKDGCMPITLPKHVPMKRRMSIWWLTPSARISRRCEMNKDLDYYMSLPYRVEVVPDEEEGGFALHCPDLNGCMTCAETLEDGFKMLEDAKRCWFTACLEDGIPIPEPTRLEDYSGQFKLRLPKSLHRLLAQKSSEEGVSMNQYCVYLLSKGI